jgi:alpha-glucosidase
LVADLAQEGIAVGVYINPFLIDKLPDRGDKQRHLFLEAEKQGFLVKNKDLEPYFITNTNFSHGLVDLSNSDARQWFKSIIKDEVLGSGAKFWMADFGEAAPFDGTFASKESGLSYHNQYPVDWVKVNREAIDEAGLAGEAWFFNRAGFLKTPQHSTGMWLGDQNTTWNENDGMPSALKGIVSAGFSGFSLNHSDIGGYTSIAFFHPIVEFLGMGFRRSSELLFRWMEMNAFTPIFRTHEGNQPDKNAQFYTDEETRTTFSYWAKIYATLADYRQQLQKEATTKGYPLVRHLILHYPDDPNVCRLETQFLLGSEFLIAPVMQSRKNSIQVYFPTGEWVHFWSGKIYGLPHQGTYQQVSAPLGQPAVFYCRGSEVGEKAIADLKAKGLCEFSKC